MEYQQLIESLTPEVYDKLKLAVELGKWPDGRRLSREQRQECLQALIAWGERNLPQEQRVGYIDRGHKAGDSCDNPGDDPDSEVPLNWRD
ncbi:DUF1315 family protein [Parahaliea maris]|uniref:DUF1315 family protein n=1 Tax=Parahaliea maris TaxID=2716870 RepID=A0A5C8ZWH6_9GAMM|nr:DUF1315 family protein [Parahaliea maris]TXS92788.1 DUF1315 family protein [Parahaliea maris]